LLYGLVVKNLLNFPHWLFCIEKPLPTDWDFTMPFSFRSPPQI
jgi:hypothetical protein